MELHYPVSLVLLRLHLSPWTLMILTMSLWMSPSMCSCPMRSPHLRNVLPLLWARPSVLLQLVSCTRFQTRLFAFLSWASCVHLTFRLAMLMFFCSYVCMFTGIFQRPDIC